MDELMNEPVVDIDLEGVELEEDNDYAFPEWIRNAPVEWKEW